MEQHEAFREFAKTLYKGLLVLFIFVGIISGLLVYLTADPDLSAFKKEEATDYVVAEEIDEDLIVDGIHVRTGLIDAEGLMVVVNNCTNCHSSKLVTQNRMNKERWEATIDWMQETQNLGDLGRNEEIIINYLVLNYPPQKKGRRQTLANIEWYELEK
jgi:hypothetical protein